jgi:hypothetical protein
MVEVVVAILIVLLIVLMILYFMYTYYVHHNYSSGSWVNKKGDIIMIRNRGVLGESQIKIGENKDGTYDVLKSKCRAIINPLARPYQFTLYLLDNPNLKAKLNILKGELQLYSGKKFYGTYYRNNL